MCVVITGSLGAGIEDAYGPFNSPDEAIEWAEGYLTKSQWSVIPLHSPRDV
jgi:hypothetical protein